MEPRRILIVEDDAATREVLKNILESEGYPVTLAADGGEGLLWLKMLPKRPGIILLDMMMPGTNGWQFLEQQRADPELADIPVIVCSAFPETAVSVHPAAVINKPIALSELLRTVSALMACSAPQAAELTSPIRIPRTSE